MISAWRRWRAKRRWLADRPIRNAADQLAAEAALFLEDPDSFRRL